MGYKLSRGFSCQCICRYFHSTCYSRLFWGRDTCRGRSPTLWATCRQSGASIWTCIGKSCCPGRSWAGRQLVCTCRRISNRPSIGLQHTCPLLRSCSRRWDKAARCTWDSVVCSCIPKGTRSCRKIGCRRKGASCRCSIHFGPG